MKSLKDSQNCCVRCKKAKSKTIMQTRHVCMNWGNLSVHLGALICTKCAKEIFGKLSEALAEDCCD